MSTQLFDSLFGAETPEQVEARLVLHRGYAALEAKDEDDAFVRRWMERAQEAWKMQGRRELVAELDGSTPGWREKGKRRAGGPRFAGICSYCLQASEELERDHIVAFSRGGSDDPNNLTPICRSCNAKKGDKSLLEFVAGAPA